MFSIDERNKIKLTIGDTATFSCIITDLDNDIVAPDPDNTLTFYIDDIGFSKQAVIDNGQYVFIIAGSDTLDLESGVYLYRVVLDMNGAQYTIFQDDFIELLSDREKSTPEPTPDPDIDLDPEPEILVPAEGSYVITFGNPVCYAGDNIVVKMRVALEIAAVNLSLVYDAQRLQMTGWSGGLGNAVITYNANSITVNDYATSGESVAEYSFNFKALNTGSAFVRISEIVEITDGNGDPMAEDYVSESSITINARPSASSEARLQSLTFNPGVLNRTFDPDWYEYTINLEEYLSEISFQYTTMDSNANVTYWPYSEPNKVALNNGENQFYIRVTAQDGVTTINYVITINCPEHQHEYVYTEWQYDGDYDGGNPWHHARTGRCSCGDVITEIEPCQTEIIDPDLDLRRCTVCGHTGRW